MLARIRPALRFVLPALCVLITACAAPGPEELAPEPESSPVPAPPPPIPPAEETALGALESSPRHGEWVDVEIPGSDVPIRTWVVYPERSDNAPLVVVIHEIFGLTDWIRGVADQLAADGFIALAPDLLSGRGPDGGGTEAFGGRDAVVAAIQELPPSERTDGLDAVRTYAMSIPAGERAAWRCGLLLGRDSQLRVCGDTA